MDAQRAMAPNTITLSADITLAAALPTITAKLTIDGDDHSISGDDTYAILVVRDVDITVQDLTLTAGSGINGGAIYIQDGSLVANNVVITENIARDHGGGIYVSNGTMDILNGSEITKNTAGDTGGGIWVNNVNTSITDSEINENVTNAGGGGLSALASQLTLTHVTLAYNTGTEDGGGLIIQGSDGFLKIAQHLNHRHNERGRLRQRTER
jgi:predicted outer membrane repeat protein